MGIKHNKTATKPDDPDAEVNKGEWNENHKIDGDVDFNSNSADNLKDITMKSADDSQTVTVKNTLNGADYTVEHAGGDWDNMASAPTAGDPIRFAVAGGSSKVLDINRFRGTRNFSNTIFWEGTCNANSIASSQLEFTNAGATACRFTLTQLNNAAVDAIVTEDSIQPLLGQLVGVSYVIREDEDNAGQWITTRVEDGVIIHGSDNDYNRALQDAIDDNTTAGGVILLKRGDTEPTLTGINVNEQGITIRGESNTVDNDTDPQDGIQFNFNTAGAACFTISKRDCKIENVSIVGGDAVDAANTVGIKIIDGNQGQLNNISITGEENLDFFAIGILFESTAGNGTTDFKCEYIKLKNVNIGIKFDGSTASSGTGDTVNYFAHTSIQTAQDTGIWFRKACDGNYFSFTRIFSLAVGAKGIRFGEGTTASLDHNFSMHFDDLRIGSAGDATTLPIVIGDQSDGILIPATIDNYFRQGTVGNELTFDGTLSSGRPTKAMIPTISNGANTDRTGIRSTFIVSSPPGDNWLAVSTAGTEGTLVIPKRTTADNTVVDADFGNYDAAIGVNDNNDSLYVRSGSAWIQQASASNTSTLTNKTIALGSNTISGTLAEFNTAITDDDICSLGGAETIAGAKTFSADVTLSGASTDLIITPKAKLRLDGSAAGDTYIWEKSANRIDIRTGGAIRQLITTTYSWITNADMRLDAAKKFYLAGFSDDTYISQSAADRVQIVSGDAIALDLQEGATDATEVNVVPGAQNILASNATDGYLYIPYTTGGAPSGTPTAYTGKSALHYDEASQTLEVYDVNAGAWRTIATV